MAAKRGNSVLKLAYIVDNSLYLPLPHFELLGRVSYAAQQALSCAERKQPILQRIAHTKPESGHH
jgi:hypothetical protein